MSAKLWQDAGFLSVGEKMITELANLKLTPKMMCLDGSVRHYSAAETAMYLEEFYKDRNAGSTSNLPPMELFLKGLLTIQSVADANGSKEKSWSNLRDNLQLAFDEEQRRSVRANAWGQSTFSLLQRRRLGVESRRVVQNHVTAMKCLVKASPGGFPSTVTSILHASKELARVTLPMYTISVTTRAANSY
eukprot:GHVN01070361.1.p1 GENE.GHVN01070361.1~~GHVN01070361.1.p1  ORF type:complete len:210 (+),score=4.06 GHVN01070361.1:62-631(+)